MEAWANDSEDLVSTAAPGTTSVHSALRRDTQTSAAFNLAADGYRKITALEQEVAQLRRLLQQHTEANIRLREKLRDSRAVARALRADLVKLSDSTQTLFVLVQGLATNLAQVREYIGLRSNAECLACYRTTSGSRVLTSPP